MVINISTQRELFVDDYLIDYLADVEMVLHRPILAPSEEKQPSGAYATLLKLGKNDFRMYFRIGDPSNYEYAYAESDDGIEWDRQTNSIFLKISQVQNTSRNNFSPFIDTNVVAKLNMKLNGI